FNFHLGNHPAGADVVDADAVLRQGAGEVAGHGDHAALRAGVGEEVGAADVGVCRADVDDRAAAHAAHGGRGVLAAEESALQVDGKDPVPERLGGLFQGGAGIDPG